ncbi:Inorganic pyrophosphatase [Candidatus Fokinia solitaria]|uniref:Inorganic pyrophosphatase n=1 Tax=Candidatus Fokinia solitaria TaxID=1802984 RepID=A0A2U8BS82_9RICK|nr:inorganic diphosphatase [Candidatus Fokinia solitaria]AWD33140.1 Inorganic pyrophosphatase [Candidatus Fokinia solitaria]
MNDAKEFDIMIEIKRGSNVKYEFDADYRCLRLDRILPTSMVFPVSYGFFTEVKGEDGDPLDALLMSSSDISNGIVIKGRVIGVMRMEDEKGIDDKILLVPSKKIDKMMSHVDSYLSLNAELLEQIEHFFTHYKDMEKKDGKWVKVLGWRDSNEAFRIIEDCLQKYGPQKFM